MKKTKRIVALLLVVCMVFGMISHAPNAYAATGDSVAEAATLTNLKDVVTDTPADGDYVYKYVATVDGYFDVETATSTNDYTPKFALYAEDGVTSLSSGDVDNFDKVAIEKGATYYIVVYSQSDYDYDVWEPIKGADKITWTAKVYECGTKNVPEVIENETMNEGGFYSPITLKPSKDGFYYTYTANQTGTVTIYVDNATSDAFEVAVVKNPGATTHPFKDVEAGAYYEAPVLWAVGNGITAGVSKTSFAPAATCTRAQIVSFLWRALGSPEPTTTQNPFKDVKEGEYYYKAVLWAVENGITAGVSKTKFAPEDTCTRAQVVSFLWRALGSPEPTTTQNPFKDVVAAEYYYEAVLWAVENGITAGESATKFAPTKGCTRGQVVSFLYRTYYEEVKLSESETVVEIPGKFDWVPATIVTVVEVEVEKGDTVLIHAYATGEESVDVDLHATFKAPLGTVLNPYVVSATNNTLVVPAGASYYFQVKSEQIVTLTGTGAFEVVSTLDPENVVPAVNGKVEMEAGVDPNGGNVVLYITNKSDAEVTYTVTAAYPEGHQENPTVIEGIYEEVEGELESIVYSHTFEGGEYVYYYTYTATTNTYFFVDMMPETEEGQVEATSTEETEEIGWAYTYTVYTADGEYVDQGTVEFEGYYSEARKIYLEAGQYIVIGFVPATYDEVEDYVNWGVGVDAELTWSFSLMAPGASMEYPEVVGSLANMTTVIEEDGYSYFYQINSEVDGYLEFFSDKVTSAAEAKYVKVAVYDEEGTRIDTFTIHNDTYLRLVPVKAWETYYIEIYSYNTTVNYSTPNKIADTITWSGIIYECGTEAEPEPIDAKDMTGEYGWSADLALDPYSYGRYYTYEATQAGTVKFYVSGYYGGTYEVALTKGETTVLLSESTATIDVEGYWGTDTFKAVEMEVEKGDIINIHVTAEELDEDCDLVELMLVGSHLGLPGAQNNPMAVGEEETTITIGAGDTAYFSVSNGAYVTATGTGTFEMYAVYTEETVKAEEGKAVIYAGITYHGNTCLVTLKNTSNAEVTYTISALVPLGTMFNPEAIEGSEAEFEAEFEAMDTEKYYIEFTAEEGSLVTISFPIETSWGIEYYFYSGDSTQPYNGGECHYASENVVLEFEVPAGDRLVIGVVPVTYDEEGESYLWYSVTGATLKWNVEVEGLPLGAKANPEVVTETKTVTLSASEDVESYTVKYVFDATDVVAIAGPATGEWAIEIEFYLDYGFGAGLQNVMNITHESAPTSFTAAIADFGGMDGYFVITFTPVTYEGTDMSFTITITEAPAMDGGMELLAK